MSGVARRLAWIAIETWGGVRTRKLRATSVIVATAFAVGLISFTSIATALARQRVGEQFDSVTNSRVVVTRATATDRFPDRATTERIENEALIDRGDEPVVASLPFVDAAGVFATLERIEIAATGIDPHPIQIGAVSPAAFPLVARVTVGAGIRGAMDGASVIVVAGDVAEHVGMPYRWAENYLVVGGRPHAVVGVADIDPPPGELWDALIPHQEGYGVRGIVASARGVLGAAEVDAVAAAVAGHDATGVKVDVPLAPYALRARVLSELAASTRRLGLAVLAAAAASMSAIGFVTVLERRWEIGLRRAVGATGLDIAVQFIGEAALLGLIGGLVGVLGGTVVIAGLVALPGHALAEAVTGALLAGGLLGAATGLASGALPTVLAVRIEPIDALRSR